LISVNHNSTAHQTLEEVKEMIGTERPVVLTFDWSSSKTILVTPQFPKQHLLSNERLSLAVSAATAAVAKQQAAKEQKARNAASFSSSSSLASPSSPPPSPPFSSSTSSSPPSSSEHTTTSPPRQYMGVTDLWSDLGQNEMKEMKEEEKRRKEMSKVHNKKKRYDEKAIQVMAQSNNYTNQEITKEIRRRQMNGVAGKPKKLNMILKNSKNSKNYLCHFFHRKIH